MLKRSRRVPFMSALAQKEERRRPPIDHLYGETLAGKVATSPFATPAEASFRFSFFLLNTTL